MEQNETELRFEKRKKVVLNELDKIESEIKILKERISKAKQIVKEFKTDEEAKEWCNNFDLEAGLKHIKLYYD